MKPEELFASLVAKAKKTQIISRELESPPPPPPPPPRHHAIPSVVIVNHESRGDKVGRSRPTARPFKTTKARGVPPPPCFIATPSSQQGPSLSSSRPNLGGVVRTTQSTPQTSTSAAVTGKHKARSPSPTSIIRRVETSLSLEEMSELRNQLVATSSPEIL